MESHVIEAAKSLKRQFEEASLRWPNLTSVLVLWPEGEPCPELPAAIEAQIAVPVAAPQGQLHWVALYGARMDTPKCRYRTGFSGKLIDRRRFGQFGGPQNEIANPDEEQAAIERFKALVEYANQVVDDLGGGGLSADTLVWSHQTRWKLAVHELTKPARFKPAGTDALCEVVPDLFLASSLSIARLLTAPTDDLRERRLRIDNGPKPSAVLDDVSYSVPPNVADLLEALIIADGQSVSMTAHGVRSRQIDNLPDELSGLIERVPGGGTRIPHKKLWLS